MEQNKMSGVSRKDWPVGGEPALTKKNNNTHQKKKQKKTKPSESTYTCARVSAMPSSTHVPFGTCVSIRETWRLFQSHAQSVTSWDRDEA